MSDQAYKLRKLIENLKERESNFVPTGSGKEKSKKAKVIAVTSGKGGVGKSNITINLAIAISEFGKKVVVIDADLGLANVDVLFGIIPKFTLLDVIKGDKSIIDVLEDGPGDVKFISGGSGIEELARINRQELSKFISRIGVLDSIADVVIIDTGAGVSENVMKFVMSSDEVVLVATPEPTSITDAYALIKMISKRNSQKDIKVLINRAENAQEAKKVLNKLKLVADKFLNVKLDSLGFILQDDEVVKAVKHQQPVTLYNPKSHAAKHLRQIAKNLMDDGLNNKDSAAGIKGFVDKLINFMSA